MDAAESRMALTIMFPTDATTLCHDMSIVLNCYYGCDWQHHDEFAALGIVVTHVVTQLEFSCFLDDQLGFVCA